ncbi:hypothetical protein CP8484711_1958A, partial [Chlamydia psittaci 84-8471/1]
MSPTRTAAFIPASSPSKSKYA